MDWGSYEQETEKALQTILTEWQNDDPDVDEMTKRLNDVADGLLPTKIVCQHSKPWVTKELSEQFKRSSVQLNENGSIDGAQETMQYIRRW